MLEHAIEARMEARREALLPKPKYYCKNCKSCTRTGGEIVEGLLTAVSYRCSFFDRRVNPNYNKCFSHSNYSPVHTKYKEPENLVELVLEEEEKRIA